GLGESGRIAQRGQSRRFVEERGKVHRPYAVVDECQTQPVSIQNLDGLEARSLHGCHFFHSSISSSRCSATQAMTSSNRSRGALPWKQSVSRLIRTFKPLPIRCTWGGRWSRSRSSRR